MAIAFRNAGTTVTDATAPFTQVVGLPASLASGDIVILIAATDNDLAGNITIDAAGSITTWNALTGSPVSVAGSGGTGEKLWVWWGRYTSGSTGPTVTS